MTRRAYDEVEAARHSPSHRTTELPLFSAAMDSHEQDAEAMALNAEQEREKSLDEQFAAFHRENPRVYGELRARVRRLVERGHSHIGVGMVWESMRYDAMVSCHGEPWKLNNSYRSRYARLLIEEDPTLDGVIETRALRSA